MPYCKCLNPERVDVFHSSNDLTSSFLRCRRNLGYLVLLAACGAGLVHAQSVLAPPQPARVQNALTTAATNVGLTACKPALDRLSTLAINGTKNNDVLLDWDRKRPATSPVFAMIGLEYPNGGAAMSITTIPDGAGGCSVAAERISSAPVACEAVAGQELNGYRATRLLSNMTVYTDGKDPNSTVSLIDTPPGCLVIRRYIEFNWKARSK